MQLLQVSRGAPSFLLTAKLPRHDRMAIATPIHRRRLHVDLRSFPRERFPNSRKFPAPKYLCRGQTEGMMRLLHSAARWPRAGPQLSAVRIRQDTVLTL